MHGSSTHSEYPYDNACTESSFAQLKKERIHRRNYRTTEEVEADLFDDIELFYNWKRIHSTLNSQTLIGFRFSNTAFDYLNEALLLKKYRFIAEKRDKKCKNAKPLTKTI